jgi:hypothetical protein
MNQIEPAEITQIPAAQLGTSGEPSRNILSAGYDEPTRTLEVVFNSGGRYRYFDVPVEVWQNLADSESVGGYIQRNVVKATYRYRKVEPTAK